MQNTQKESLQNFSRNELREKCKEVGIRNFGKLNSQQLRDLLKDHVTEGDVEVIEGEAQQVENDENDEIELPVGSRVSKAASIRESRRSMMMLLGLEPVFPPVLTQTTIQVVDGKKIEITKRSVLESKQPQDSIKDVEAGLEQMQRVSTKGITVQKEREVRNGVKRPSVGTVCAKVWEEFDKNPKITSKELPALAEKHGWNKNNVSCEFYVWRKFMGLTKARK